MRFQVPQFVDIEDKIIGPFTLKQFLMYVVAVMVLIPVYLFSDLSLFITIAIPIMGIAAVFAHLKINEKTFGEVLMNAVQYYLNPQLYIWRRTGKQKPLKIKDPEWEELLKRPAGQQEMSTLNAIAQSLETDGNVSEEDLEDPLADEEGDTPNIAKRS